MLDASSLNDLSTTLGLDLKKMKMTALAADDAVFSFHLLSLAPLSKCKCVFFVLFFCFFAVEVKQHVLLSAVNLQTIRVI